jgi:hypothetical protein
MEIGVIPRVVEHRRLGYNVFALNPIAESLNHMFCLPLQGSGFPRSIGFLVVLLTLVATMIPRPGASQSVGAADEPATLQPGDRIKVSIWREDDLSGDFHVDEAGRVTLPLLGEVRVTDIPLPELRRVLGEEYRVHLRNPSINIVPLRKILVLGEVRNPGPYEVDPTESILGVIAQAGGATSAGNIERVGIIRNQTVVSDRVALEQTLSALQMRSGDQVVVYPRSWLARNQSFVISVLLALPGVVFTITRIME